MEPKYRIVVHEDYSGNIWYKPQVKKHFFDTWGHLESKTYSESYNSEDRALEVIEYWKEVVAKRKFKDKIITIINNI